MRAQGTRYASGSGSGAPGVFVGDSDAHQARPRDGADCQPGRRGTAAACVHRVPATLAEVDLAHLAYLSETLTRIKQGRGTEQTANLVGAVRPRHACTGYPLR